MKVLAAFVVNGELSWPTLFPLCLAATRCKWIGFPDNLHIYSVWVHLSQCSSHLSSIAACMWPPTCQSDETQFHQTSNGPFQASDPMERQMAWHLSLRSRPPRTQGACAVDRFWIKQHKITKFSFQLMVDASGGLRRNCYIHLATCHQAILNNQMSLS